MQLSDRQSAARGCFGRQARELVDSHYDNFSKESDFVARQQMIARLADPPYYRFIYRDYTEEVRISLDLRDTCLNIQ